MFKLKRSHILTLLAYALANSILSFAIIFMINKTLSGDPTYMKDYMAFVFIAFVVYTYFLNIVFQKELNTISFRWLYDFEKKIFGQFLKAPLLRFEKFGSKRFFTAVEDLRLFAILPNVITHTSNSLLMLLLCLIYLFSISVGAAIIVVTLIVGVAACYLFVMKSMSKKVAMIRAQNEAYFGFVDDVIKGFKELKISFFRREKLLNSFLLPNRDTAQHLDTEVNYVFLSINLISQYGLYFVIGVILYILPMVGLLPRDGVIAYTVVILFMAGPINILINFQQIYTRLFVANKRIRKFLADFQAEDHKLLHRPPRAESFQHLVFEDLTFSYSNENEHETSFSLGPLNLQVEKGEVLFIVGGNGSGKSTFINLLTGLYPPSGGKIILNGQVVDRHKNDLQEMIAAVFTDNHLFSQHYEEYELDNNPAYSAWLKTMKLEEVLKKEDEQSAQRKFSKGQSKRMSLIFAMLEDRPILVLDEWAADQDPHFRKFFYEELIPQIKEQGKTIIAVTHDDAYFHLADRLIKFDFGQIVKNVARNQLEGTASSFWG